MGGSCGSCPLRIATLLEADHRLTQDFTTSAGLVKKGVAIACRLLWVTECLRPLQNLSEDCVNRNNTLTQARSQGGLGVKSPKKVSNNFCCVVPYMKIYLNSSLLPAKILNQLVFHFHR